VPLTSVTATQAAIHRQLHCLLVGQQIAADKMAVVATHDTSTVGTWLTQLIASVVAISSTFYIMTILYATIPPIALALTAKSIFGAS